MADKVDYFKLTPIYHWVWVIFGMSLLGVMACSPSSIPYTSLGPVGSFLHYLAYEHSLLLQIVFLIAMLAHLLEGLVAFILCLRMNLTVRDTCLWTGQTLLLGFSSLLPLRAKYKKMKSQ